MNGRVYGAELHSRIKWERKKTTTNFWTFSSVQIDWVKLNELNSSNFVNFKLKLPIKRNCNLQQSLIDLNFHFNCKAIRCCQSTRNFQFTHKNVMKSGRFQLNLSVLLEEPCRARNVFRIVCDGKWNNFVKNNRFWLNLFSPKKIVRME